MRLAHKIALSIILSCLLSITNAATSNDNINVRVDGYASFVGGSILGTDAYHSSGYDEDLRFDQDSLIATQIKADMGDGLSATTQFLGKAIDGYDVEMEWAYIKYQASPEWSGKIGKVRAPNYIYSDYLNVGYAYHWISPPPLVYDLPFDTIQGLQIEYLTDLGSWNSRIDLTLGTTREDYLIGSEKTYIDFRNAIGANWDLSYDWISLRIGWAETEKITIPSANLEALAASLAVFNVAEEIDDIRIKDDRARFGTLGISIEYGNYLAVAEYTTVTLDHSISPDQENYYLSLGRHFGKLLLHLSYEVDDEPAKVELATALANKIPAVTPLLAATQQFVKQQIINTANSLAFDSEAWTLGVRYDFHPSAALKVEYKKQDNHFKNTSPELILFGVNVVF